MKHLKKKFLKDIKIDEEAGALFKTVTVDDTALNKLAANNFDNHYMMALTHENQFIQMFKYHRKKSTYFFPEPNPIVIYLWVAQQNIADISKTRASLLLDGESKTPSLTSMTNDIYRFIGHATACAFFLFNAIEAFINLKIPEDYVHVIEGERETKTHTKDQIQKWFSFEDKMKKILPIVTEKVFHQEYGHLHDRLMKLKILRDEIAHTKTYSGKKPNFYEPLITSLLDFDYEKALHACRDYINYYEPGLIEECDCGINN